MIIRLSGQDTTTQDEGNQQGQTSKLRQPSARPSQAVSEISPGGLPWAATTTGPLKMLTPSLEEANKTLPIPLARIQDAKLGWARGKLALLAEAALKPLDGYGPATRSEVGTEQLPPPPAGTQEPLALGPKMMEGRAGATMFAAAPSIAGGKPLAA